VVRIFDHCKKSKGRKAIPILFLNLSRKGNLKRQRPENRVDISVVKAVVADLLGVIFAFL
jgi:hypothetical protein